MPSHASNYSPAITALLETEVQYPLVPASPVAEFQDQLAALTHAELSGGQPIADPAMADACLSGLWLRFDFLDRSHTISQDIHTSTGSYWHGIMHRREPDWSNGKYWFRQVGEHEVFDDLSAAARLISEDVNIDAEVKSLTAANTWDPFAFVDLCQRAHHNGGELETFCRQIQMAEWGLLFDWCYRRAISE